MYEKFDKRKYCIFLKKMYSQCDIIEADFGNVIGNINVLEGGKYSSICSNVIDNVIQYINNRPYSALKLIKNYSLYNYLMAIDNWEFFTEEDPVSEFHLSAIYFYCGENCIGGIESYYRAYNSHFFEC